MTSFSIVLVLLAAFLRASWNALLRGGADRTQSMLIMNVTVGTIGLMMIIIAGLPSAVSAVYIIASGLIHLVYNALLVRMYHSGDLGETYPVARGSSPALVALGASVFAGEWMSVVATVGLGLVCAGIFMLATAKGRLHAMNLPWALATGLSIAAYTVVDGIGVRASGNWIAYTGNVRVLSRRAAVVPDPARSRVVWDAPGGSREVCGRRVDFTMGAVSALRETSVVFAALLGAAFLNERLTLQRTIACCIIAAGAAGVRWKA